MKFKVGDIIYRDGDKNRLFKITKSIFNGYVSLEKYSSDNPFEPPGTKFISVYLPNTIWENFELIRKEHNHPLTKIFV